MDPRWSQGRATPVQFFFIFIQFSAKILLNNRFSEGLAPSDLGNPGFATAEARYFLNKRTVYSVIHKAGSFTIHSRSTGLPGIIPVEQKSVH